MDKLIIARKLKNLREQKNISQEQAARDLGITLLSIADYETGKRIPRDGIKLKMIVYYNTEPSIFLSAMLLSVTKRRNDGYNISR